MPAGYGIDPAALHEMFVSAKAAGVPLQVAYWDARRQAEASTCRLVA
eukprot:SAG11_NODE_18625_length_485_cov_1.256477_1_plen_46_part_10